MKYTGNKPKHVFNSNFCYSANVKVALANIILVFFETGSHEDYISLKSISLTMTLNYGFVCVQLVIL